jgi:hypothetical protein
MVVISRRFSPSFLFLVSALIGAFCSLPSVLGEDSLPNHLTKRGGG